MSKGDMREIAENVVLRSWTRTFLLMSERA